MAHEISDPVAVERERVLQKLIAEYRERQRGGLSRMIRIAAERELREPAEQHSA